MLRLLGADPDYGAMLGLSDDWAANILSQVGNYSESFEKHIGPNTSINIQRGLNALYKDGGIYTHLHLDRNIKGMGLNPYP